MRVRLGHFQSGPGSPWNGAGPCALGLRGCKNPVRMDASQVSCLEATMRTMRDILVAALMGVTVLAFSSPAEARSADCDAFRKAAQRFEHGADRAKRAGDTAREQRNRHWARLTWQRWWQCELDTVQRALNPQFWFDRGQRKRDGRRSDRGLV
jgi:hypothetical protein